MINEAQLEERLETKNRKGPGIVITVENKADISKLYAKRFRFGKATKKVEKYWEVTQSSIYMTCLGIGHD